MPIENLHLAATLNLANLCNNPYPGRGIILGRAVTGEVVQGLCIMGRGPDSRNRVLSIGTDEAGRVFTEAADPQKVNDASNRFYTGMRESFGTYVVSNGNHTDTIVDGFVFKDDRLLHNLLLSREYEDDVPNSTARITGMFLGRHKSAPAFQLSTLRKSPFSDACDRHNYCYDDILPGFGYYLATYAGDGKPLPTWEGGPMLVPLTGTIDQIADQYFFGLNQDNIVSVSVKFISLDGRDSTLSIRNKYKKVVAR